jgi:hypothetical protein
VWVILDDLQSLLHDGPICIGRVVHLPKEMHRLQETSIETWPLNQHDAIGKVRTDGITFFVQSENPKTSGGESILCVRMGLSKETAARLQRVLEAWLSTGDAQSSPPLQLSRRQKLHQNSSCELGSEQQRSSQYTRTSPSRESRSMTGTESPIQELLRKVNELQEQMKDFTLIKNDILELKAGMVLSLSTFHFTLSHFLYPFLPLLLSRDFYQISHACTYCTSSHLAFTSCELV